MGTTERTPDARPSVDELQRKLSAAQEEIVRLSHETKEAIAQQTAVSDVLRAMSRAPYALDELLQATIDHGTTLCRAENGLVYLMSGDELRLRADSRGAPPEAKAYELTHPTPVDRSTAVGRAAVERNTVHITDVLADPDYRWESQKLVGYRTLLAVPIRRANEILGVIAFSRGDVRPFSEREIALVETFANQAAIAIETVRLFNETKDALEQQTATNEILKVISRSTADLQPVFDFVVENANRLCAADYAFVYLPEGDTFRSVASFGGSPELVEINREERRFRGRGTLVGRVALEERVVQIPDVLEDPEYTLRQTQRVGGYRTMLGVPMKRGDGALVGIIGMARNDVRPFTAREIQLVETFAQQSVIAIENVRLFNETKEALKRQTALAEILRVISRSPTDVQPVLDAIAESAARFCAAEDVSVGLMEGETWRIRAHHGLVEIRLDVTSRIGPTFVSGRSMIERRTIHVPDLQAEADQYPDGVAGSPTTRAIVATPLLSAAGPIGAIFLRRTEATPFTERQIELAETFAAQAVIAIENVRLFNETKEALEQQTATSDILKVIAASPSDITPVLDAIAGSAARFCVAENVSVVLQGEDGLLQIRAHVGPLGTVIPPWVVDRTTVSGRSIMEARTIQVPDLQAAGDEYPLGQAQALVLGERTTMAAPLIRDGRGIGVLFLRRGEVRPFSDKQVELVKVFADQAVIAIENVRLFNETNEALERQTATSEVLKVISTSTSELQPVFEAVVRKANDLCGAEWSLLWLRRDDGFHLAASYGIGEEFLASQRDRLEVVGRGSIVGRTALEDRPIHLPDILADPDYIYPEDQRLSGARTVLGVPIRREHEVIGVIALDRNEVRPFSDTQIRLVQTFADQAAIAMENVRLFNETKEALERQRTTADILYTISTSPTTDQPVLEAVARNALRFCGAEDVLVLLVDGDVLERRAHAGTCV